LVGFSYSGSQWQGGSLIVVKAWRGWWSVPSASGGFGGYLKVFLKRLPSGRLRLSA